MKKMNGIAAWGIGCALELFLLVVAVAAMDGSQAASFLLYMMALAIPAAFVRKCFFSETTPTWLRVGLGPAGALACLVTAYFMPIDLDDDDGDGPESSGAKPAETAKADAKKGDAPQEPPEKIEDVLAELDALVGLEGVKAEVRKIVNKEKVDAARRAQGLKVAPRSLHMIFTGNPGTGKTTVARIVARVFRALGVVEKGQLVETDRSGLVGGYMGETAKKTAAKCDEAIGGILFVDEAYQLCNSDNDDYGKEAIATLLKRMEDNRGNMIVIAAGYTDEMRDFLAANSGLSSRFGIKIEFADYTAPELAKIFRSMCKKNGYRLSAELEAGLDEAMARLTRRRDKTFGNARFVRQLFEDATGRQADRLAESGADLSGDALTTLEVADLGIGAKAEDVRAPTIEEVLAELDGLTGMKSVKDEIRRLVATCRANKMREAQGVEAATMSYNFVFTGNPGTGKTTVARILAKAFRALGILDRGHLVETDRAGLVAAYAGQTALKTNKLIDSAVGGILFIDEAYTLNQGQNDTYGAEAVATLLKRMEDERGRMVVIIAGYKDEMKKFFAVNSGLESRFNRELFFPDLSPEDLASIFRQTAKKNKYVLSQDVEKWLDSYMRVMTKDRTKNFGNGRWVRNLFERTVERQSLRVVDIKDPSPEELLTIRMKDVGISLKDPDASHED